MQTTTETPITAAELRDGMTIKHPGSGQVLTVSEVEPDGTTTGGFFWIGRIQDGDGHPHQFSAPKDFALIQVTTANSTDATRAARIAKLIENTQAAEDGQLEEFQTEPAQFLVVEYGAGDPLWAMAAVTLSEAAEQIDQSETQRDSVTVYDLDTTDEWTPVFETVKFFRTKGEPGDHRVMPAR